MKERNFSEFTLKYDTTHKLGEGSSAIVYKGTCSRKNANPWSCAVKVSKDKDNFSLNSRVGKNIEVLL